MDAEIPTTQESLPLTEVRIPYWQARRADDREARGVLGHHAK